MRVQINGATRDVSAETLAELIQETLGSSRGSAAVVDGAVIPRSQWPVFTVREHHRIELITAVQGG